VVSDIADLRYGAARLMKTLLLSVISGHLCPCAETGPTGILG